MRQNTSFLENVPLPERNNVLQVVVEESKTHAESREFVVGSKSPRSLEFELELAFEDAGVTRKLPIMQILWNVRQGNHERVESLSALLRLGGQRIRGVDRESAPVSYKFRVETVNTAQWHENVYSFDSSGVLKNDHVPLEDWDTTYTADEFARKTAEHWNIQTWRDQEELSLWKDQ